MAKNDSRQTLPARVKHFIFPEQDEELFNKVEDFNNYPNYAVNNSMTKSILNSLKDVSAMNDDPICSAAVKCVMQTAFQSNAQNKLFELNTPYEVIQQELDAFHEQINADNFILTDGYNNLLWGQLPWKHIYNEDGVLERVVPIPDFTSITPVIISGKVIGFMNEKGDFVPSYEYTYSQLEYYKNLGGNTQNTFMTVGGGNSNSDDNQFQNEFTYANSYLGAASKPWRNINIIEDALLLNRMDQSNYYRIISVNVGGQVYSKSAIAVLNYYRNLFKKVRRVSYDSDGMSSRGNGQNFEVIIPQTQNQGVSIQNVGGEVDVKSLKDLDVQYQKLFSALQIQPSMIGFSSDTPSSLGDSAAITWDKRFAKVCKAVSFSAFNALKNIDYLHLRSLGYNVTKDDWSYLTVSQTMLEDQDKGETLKLAVENLKNITDSLNNMNTDYNKKYLVKALLGDALANYGIDSEKLMEAEKDLGVPEDGQMMIGTSFRKGKFNSFQKEILEEDARVMVMNGIFEKKEAKEIISAMVKDGDSIIKEVSNPVTLKQVYSSFAVKRNAPMDLSNFVIMEDKKNIQKDYIDSSKHLEGEGVNFKFPIYCTKNMEITAGDLDLESISYVNNLYIDECGNHHLTSKADVCTYLYNYMNGALDNYCANVWRK